MHTPTGKSDTVGLMGSVRYHVGDVIAKLMNEADPPITQLRLAELSGRNRNTIGDLIKTGNSDQDVLDDIAKALGTSRHELEAEARRLNGDGTAPPTIRREQHERAEDHDPDLAEAVAYGKRLGKLPRLARVAVYNTIQAFEDLLRAANLKLP